MDDLIDSIRTHPEDWQACGYHFKHTPTGLSFWKANGMFFFKEGTKRLKTTFRQRWRAWRAYKWWCKNVPLTHFKVRLNSIERRSNK